MAGNYPDAPSWRMAYDRDGTQAFFMDTSNNLTQLTSGQVTLLNNEASDAYTGPGSVAGAAREYMIFLFPELRDIDGWWANIENYPSGAAGLLVQVSLNTTNGFDGTWTTQYTYPIGTQLQEVKPQYRTNIQSSTALAVRGIRFGALTSTFGPGHMQFRNVHLYGEPAPGENPNRLALWHPTLDQRVTPAYFDWGNVPRSSSADRLFRIKNLSSTLTASSVRVAMEALTDTTPSVPGQHSLSSDGTTFLAQVNIGSLSPGAISGPVTLRRVIPSNAVLSLWSFRVFAESTTGWA